MRERLFARALVLEQNGRKLCIVAPDLAMIAAPWSRRIRQAIHERCGIAYDDVMVSFPQIHSAPAIGNFILDDELPNVPPEHDYLRGSQQVFNEWATGRLIEAAVQANANLVPVEMAVGRAVRDDLAFNRRGVRRDGIVTMPWFYKKENQPLGPTDILYIEGPMDPEVGLMAFKDESGRFVAALLHHTCHPVNVYATAKHDISSDWPGTWAAGVESLLGESCVAMVLNGCCGNINPWPAFTPDLMPDHQRMGRELTRTVETLLPTLTFNSPSILEGVSRSIPLPIRDVSPADRAWAEKMLKDYPQPLWKKENPKEVEWEWMQAAMLMSLELERARSPNYDCGIQVFRVGSTAIIGLPGEPFVEGQLAIKQASPAEMTFVVHLTNDSAGYIPPVAAYARGGLEIGTKPSMIHRVAPGGLECLVEETRKTLKEMFP